MCALILGGSLIGTSIACQLAARGTDTVVVECCSVACAASGKSGGFLALDWFDGTPLGSLSRGSFALHAALAETLGTDWGYRPMTIFGGTVGSTRKSRQGGPGWMSREIALTGQLGTRDHA